MVKVRVRQGFNARAFDRVARPFAFWGPRGSEGELSVEDAAFLALLEVVEPLAPLPEEALRGAVREAFAFIERQPESAARARRVARCARLLGVGPKSEGGEAA